jgi:hypothetical protein
MRDSLKRLLSIAILTLFMCTGLFACARMARPIFVIGANDSPAAILAMLYCGFLYLPTLILAFWRRRVASIILMSMVPIWIFGMLNQRYYTQYVRHFPADPISDLLFELAVALFPMAIGAFLFITDRLKWPPLLFSDEDRRRILVGS